MQKPPYERRISALSSYVCSSDLIALAISVAFVFSVVVTLGYPGMPLWEELATLVTIMLLGHWIEMRSISQAPGALTELAKLLPSRTEGRRVRTESVGTCGSRGGAVHYNKYTKQTIIYRRQ